MEKQQPLSARLPRSRLQLKTTAWWADNNPGTFSRCNDSCIIDRSAIDDDDFRDKRSSDAKLVETD